MDYTIDNKNLFNHKIISSISFIIIMCIALGITTNIKNGDLRWNCDTPLLSSYIYLLLGFISMYFFSVMIAEYGYDNNLIPMIASIVMVFVLTYFIISTPAENIVMKHLIWFGYLFCLSMILRPSSLKGNIVINTIIISLGIFLLLTVFANIFKEYISVSWERQLIYVLILLIIVSIVSAVFFSNTKKIFTYISIVSIIVFALFFLIDTQKIQKIDCNNPDYINNTINLFLDSINIFVNVYSLNNS